MRRGALRSRAMLLAAAVVACLWTGGAGADPLRVGKAVVNFGFLPLDIGMAAGIYQRNGVEIEPFDFTGGAKQQQALTAGSIDIALGGGTDLAFIIKGAPERAIASVTSSPGFLGITVGTDANIRDIDGLKGKKLGVTTPGSLTFWLVEELNRVRGWGSDGAAPIVIGGNIATQTAAIKTHQIDGILANTGVGYAFEEQGIGRLLTPASSYASDFELFTILASTAVLEKNPDGVRRFLRSWYETVGYMKAHRDETVAIGSRVTGFSPKVEEREYDLLMPRFSTDGRFKPEALERLRGIFADLKITDAPLDLAKLTTEEFLGKM
jgi:ABC-type nitrate/sulfonate/bicarbonate transport system substrate-binding protein